MAFVVCGLCECLLFGVCCLLFVGSYVLFVARCSISLFWRCVFVVCCLFVLVLCVVCRVLFVVCCCVLCWCASFVVCCLLYDVVVHFVCDLAFVVCSVFVACRLLCVVHCYVLFGVCVGLLFYVYSHCLVMCVFFDCCVLLFLDRCLLVLVCCSMFVVCCVLLVVCCLLCVVVARCSLFII